MGGNNGGGERFTAPGTTDNTPQPGTAGTGATGTAGTGGNATPGQPQDPFASLFGAGVGNPFALPQQTPSTAAGTNTGSTETGSAPNASSPPPQPNPFANLFGAPPSTTGGATGGEQQANPFAEMTHRLMQNPEAMRAAMEMFGQMGGPAPGAGAGFSPFGAAQPGSMGANNTTNPSGTGSPAPNPFAALFGPGAFGGPGFGTPPPVDNRPPEEIYEIQLRQLNEMGFFEFERNVSALRRSGGNVQGAIKYLLNGGS